MSATISFCVCTRGPAARVRALLSLVRPYVDELVLAVDTAGDLEALEAGRELADQRLTFDFAPPPCRLIGWIQHQCNCDWLLRLDDDEIPSRALLDALPELARERRPTHFGLTRRWLYGDASTYLTGSPWQPDYQLRLLRNLPGIWHFTGLLHDPPHVLGELRLAELPIYHADLVLQTVKERRRKVAEYERLRPGYMAGDVSVNAIYLPEDWDGIVTTPVPGPDVAAINGVLHPREPVSVGPGEGAPVRDFGLAEIDRYNSTRCLSRDTYRAGIEFVRPITSMRAGTSREQEVIVRNLGDEHWPWGPHADPPIRLTYRWLTGDGGLVDEGPGTSFTETVLPGASSLVRLPVTAPERPGRFLLAVDVLHEAARWFATDATLAIDVVDESRFVRRIPAVPAPTYTGPRMGGGP